MDFWRANMDSVQWKILPSANGNFADQMIDCYRDHFKFLSALQIKYFRKKLIFYVIQCKMKGIPQSRNT